MATITPERAQAGYALANDEGETFWLLGMLQTIKIGRDDTAGRYGMAEIVVPEGSRHAHVPHGWVVRVWPKGRPSHLLRRGGRGESPGRVRADAVRGIPARSRRARARARPAAADGRPTRNGATRLDRQAKRLRDPRPSRPPARPLTHHQDKRARSHGAGTPAWDCMTRTLIAAGGVESPPLASRSRS